MQHNFIGWVRSTGLNPGLAIPRQPEIQPIVTVSDDQRWAHVELLLHDDSIPHYTRIAGLFMLLFAQPLATICRMRTNQIDLRDDGRVFVTFEKTPSQMPEPLDQLIREHLQHRGQASFAGRGSGWLFPGGIPGKPLATDNIRHQLVERGIKPYRSRKAALFQLATEIPTPLLADLLGIGQTTAVRWAALASRGWGSYIAER